MTKEERLLLVNEGFTLDQKIKQDERRLEEIKEKLAAEADGKDVAFEGTDCSASIAFYPSMCRQLAIGDEAEARKIAGGFFDKLFCRAPIAKFKDVASALLGDNAKKLIKLLSGPKSARISFKKAS